MKTDYSKILTVVALIVIMAGGYFVARKRVQFREASSLPFYTVDLQELSDGVYTGKTYTSFLHLQLEVTLENHEIKQIAVIENEGLDGEKARPIIQKMISENSYVVPAIKGAELGSLVYISCVSTALAKTENE
jgi:uncharacterized protein with FMN-binding domain